MRDTTMESKRKSMIRKVVRSVFILFAVLLGILLIALITLFAWSPGKAIPFLDQNGEPLSGSISEIVTMDIGGIEQGMIIKSKNDQNPVLLFLHGGPGSPEYILTEKYPTGLEESFTVCWWDQRGAGMSYDASIPSESMTLEQLVADTAEVTNYLRERFGQDKIYLMGHSWGTVLGVHTAAQYPELYHAYIGTGQVTDQLTSEKEAYDYMLATAKATGDKKLAKKLSAFTLDGPETVNMDYLMLRTAGMNKQGIGITHEMKSEFTDLMLPVLRCKEYSVKNKIGYLRGMLFSLDHLWSAVIEHDLSQDVQKLEIPVYICHGIYDYQVSYKGSKAYAKTLQAPHKKFYTFENSAHSPLFEEPEKFMQIMREDVLAIPK